jgi:hypothetical protein
MKELSPLIATSLIPNHRLDVQTQAIRSWLKLGLKVISLNCPDEISQLKTDFPTVEFVPQENTGLEITGKPVMFIAEILNYFSSQSTEIVGIVNSDIKLDTSSTTLEMIKLHSKEAFYFGPRYEVENFETMEGPIDPWGFDYFFFDKSFTSLWPNHQFCMGMPFWDHWFPLMAILHGKKVSRPTLPFGWHIPHETSRDDSFFTFNDQFAALLVDLMNDAKSNPLSNTHQKFGVEFRSQDYLSLRQKVVIAEMQSAPDAERLAQMEGLANYFDDLTKYVINFIHQNSQMV